MDDIIKNINNSYNIHERILLLRRIDTLLKIPGCQENFIPELEQKLDYYKRTQCFEEPEEIYL